MRWVLEHEQTRWVAEAGRLARGDLAGEDVRRLKGAAHPGLVCAHTHLYSGLAPLGLPAPEVAPENFVQILERVWWRLDRALDAASLRASARFYVANALLSGATTIIDHHESPNLIEGSLEILADACDALGARALLTYGATERNGGIEEGRAGLKECMRFVEENQRPLVRGLVGLHAPFTASDTLIREAGHLCRALGVPLHVHMAEDAADVADSVARGYASPLSRLLALDALPPHSLLIHAVHLSPDQVRLGARAGAFFVHNPRSNEGNRVGYAASLGATRDRVALGTDGYPAAMLDELAALSRLAAQHGDVTTDGRLENGQALMSALWGLPFGALEAGAAADFVIRDDAGAVQSVVVGGRLVVDEGRLLTADMDEIRAEAESEAARLWAAMRAL